MFGLFKRKPAPEGPVQVMATIDVGVSAEEFFDLLDFASPTNAKVRLGHSVTAVGTDRYMLVMNFLPDLHFDVMVEERRAPQRYAYRCPIPPAIGPLLWTREEFDIAPTGAYSCLVHFVTTGEFAPGLTMREYKGEVAKLGLAVQNSIMKLKILAEGGIDEVRAFELKQAA